MSHNTLLNNPIRRDYSRLFARPEVGRRAAGCGIGSNISKLKCGNELRKFTFDRPLTWPTKLDRDVILTVKRKSARRESGELRFAV